MTAGCILLSNTTYFCAEEAEKDKVVPTLTFMATLRGTLSKTGFAVGTFWGFTKIAT